MQKIKSAVEYLGVSRLIIICFIIVLGVLMIVLDLPIAMIASQCLVRIGMNGIFVLAMMLGIVCGIGMNFGMPIGIVCGLIGGMLSIELNIKGLWGILFAVGTSIPLAVVVGYLYGLLINRVRGSEMMVSTYVGFAGVSLMCIGWLLLPFKNPAIIWPIGKGLRTTVLASNYNKLLDNFWSINFGIEFAIPTGLLLVFAFCSFLVWLFMQSRTGIMMKLAGANPVFARMSGIDVDRMRLLGTILSTVLGAVGIVIYSQSYGFYQLYEAPLMMGFPAVAAILIGGSSPKKATILNVVMGTVLFQSLLTMALPVANKLVVGGNLSEIGRVIVSNGIILYALTKMVGGSGNES